MEHYDWNENWQFTPVFTPALCDADCADPALEPVRIPHTVKPLPYNYCNENDYQLVSGYRRVFTAPADWQGRRVLLTFGAAAHEATVYCNGIEVARHACGYTAFTADLSDALHYGGRNVVAVRCDSREALDIPPFGGRMDALSYGGLYRAVTLDVKDAAYLRDVFVTAAADGSFRIYPTLEGEILGCVLRAEIVNRAGRSAVFSANASLPLVGSLNGVQVWSIDSPVLYTLNLQLIRTGTAQNGLPDRVLDEKTVRFGFRTVEFVAGGLYLNGEKVKLRGLNRHQCFAYQGYAMPDSMQRLDALLLKKRLGCNAVRTSRAPQSPAFLDACDELGLLVFTEMPGCPHLGDAAWKEQALQNCREMALQCRNHPSVFLWGVRVSESADDDALSRKTNEAVHRLDPTRPTSGVHNAKKGHFLEDVYAYNDYSHTGQNAGCEPKQAVTPDPKKGYLISEYGGYRFPAKPFDDEAHRLAHALHYAAVLNDAALQGGVAGSFGQCMFDYNTHKDFGSGDRICYHGVMDRFRGEKLAAAVFASQKTPHAASDVVLAVSSGMDSGDHPSGVPGACWVFTNADSVKLYKNDTFIAEFRPAPRGRYGALAHPPIEINNFIGGLLEKYEGFDHAAAVQIGECLNAIRREGGELPPLVKAKLARLMLVQHMTWEDGRALYDKYIGCGGGAARYRFDALWHGRVVRSVIKEPVQRVRLECTVRNPILTDGPTWDCAAVMLRAIDQNGNVLPYCGEAVVLTLDGPAKLLGPSVVPLRGGMAGTYVATTGQAGRAVLHACMEGALPAEVTMTIRRREE